MAEETEPKQFKVKVEFEDGESELLPNVEASTAAELFNTIKTEFPEKYFLASHPVIYL